LNTEKKGGEKMSEGKLAQFSNQKYLNIETYKKSGQTVQTPVWFIEDNGVLFVHTMLTSGKVKRVRKNPHVRVVPCSAQESRRVRGLMVRLTSRMPLSQNG